MDDTAKDNQEQPQDQGPTQPMVVYTTQDPPKENPPEQPKPAPVQPPPVPTPQPEAPSSSQPATQAPQRASNTPVTQAPIATDQNQKTHTPQKGSRVFRNAGLVLVVVSLLLLAFQLLI